MSTGRRLVRRMSQNQEGTPIKAGRLTPTRALSESATMDPDKNGKQPAGLLLLLCPGILARVRPARLRCSTRRISHAPEYVDGQAVLALALDGAVERQGQVVLELMA